MIVVLTFTFKGQKETRLCVKERHFNSPMIFVKHGTSH